MSEHRPEVADVIREHGATFLERYRPSKEQRRVLTDLVQCRTAALGGHAKMCDQCGHIVCVYNSCRNRHCPKCQGAARAAWLQAREQEVLDAQYFHVVFTLPHELAPLALQNRRTVYGILFRAASETLSTLARDPKHLGAQIGCLALLHTWGQNLLAHPHLHCVIPGGGISPDGKRWVSCRDGFFLPVRVMSRMFRGKFLAMLVRAFEQNELEFHGQLAQLNHPKAWEGWLEPLRNKQWVVYAKPPFGGPRQVLKYLARYTHRVAISNRRILSTDNATVTFTWKDYASGNTRHTMTLDAQEFLRRFLLHVLPPRFTRIRYFGFLANRNRADNVRRARLLIEADTQGGEVADGAAIEATSDETSPQLHNPTGSDDDDELERCPRCKQGRLILILRVGYPPKHETWSFDSS